MVIHRPCPTHPPWDGNKDADDDGLDSPQVPVDEILSESVLTRPTEYRCPAGFYCQGGVAFPCPAGRYGGREGETLTLCSGPCASGYWCPEGSNASTQIACGDPRFYCPEGEKGMGRPTARGFSLVLCL
jgi:hypothetical protein